MQSDLFFYVPTGLMIVILILLGFHKTAGLLFALAVTIAIASQG